MRILLTNDDGIHAPGLVVLQDIARTLSDDVWVVAPELDQSGASHAITLRAPLRMRELSPKVHAVTGTERLEQCFGLLSQVLQAW